MTDRKCEKCTKPATVIINNRQACSDHIDEIMGAAFAPVRQLMRVVK